MLFDLLSDHTRLEFPNDDVAIVIDRDSPDEMQSRALYAYRKARAPQFASFAVGDRRKFRAIQCADLAAGHWRRRWLEAEFGSDSPVPTRLAATGLRGRFAVRSAKAQERAEAALKKLNAPNSNRDVS
jgi:hypothetical protein